MLTLIGGPFVDWVGAASLSMVFFSIIMLIGQLVFSIGVSFNDWGVMLSGRFIYGLAGDNIAIAKTALLALWFDGSEMSFAFGCALTIGRIGGVVGNFIAPKMANDWGVPNAIWFGTLVNVVGTLGSFLILYVDQRAKIRYGYDDSVESVASSEHENDPMHEDTKNSDLYDSAKGSGNNTKTTKKKRTQNFRFSDVKKFDSVYWLLTVSFVVVSGVVIPFNTIASGLLLERDLFKTPPTTCQLEIPNQCSTGTLAPASGNPASDIITGELCPGSGYAPAFPSTINITAANTSGSWDEEEYVFVNLTMTDIRCNDEFWRNDCTANYCDAQDDATELAGIVMSTPYMVSAVFAIPLGACVDKFGRRTYIATVGFTILFVAHVLIAHTSTPAVIALVFQGLAHSAYGGILWPSVPLVIDPNLLGTAYGVMLSVQNAFLSLIPMFVAFLYQIGNSQYIPNVEILFYSLGALGVFTGILLIIEDKRTGNRLNMSYKKQPNADFAATMLPGEKLSDETVNEYISDAFD